METAYFENIRFQILKALESATEKIQVAVCWFTNEELFEKLCDKLSSGVSVELIILNDYINNRKDGLNFQSFVDLGGRLYFGSTDKPMHNKYCIIDESLLLNGSYNWTYYAEEKNEENLVIHSNNVELLKSFMADFERIKVSIPEIKVVKKQTITSINFHDAFGVRSYLANDYVFKALKFNDTTIVKRAISIAEDKKMIRRTVAQLNLVDRKELILTIGETIHGNIFSKIIPTGTIIPFIANHSFRTVIDNQLAMAVNIGYGESDIGSENTLIGSFVIRGLPPRKAGEALINTTYKIEIDGYLTVIKEIELTKKRITRIFNINNILKNII